MGGYTKDAMINHDKNLRLQYLAGLGLNLYQSDPIYQDILSHAGRFPEELFTGTPETIQQLRDAIRRTHGR
jgi:spermidine synthase